MHFIESGALQMGDYLICDNAAVHVNDEAFQRLAILCEQAGVKVRFLPKYSPELNPCELVFGFTKNHLRNWKGTFHSHIS
jgi:transposase